MTALTTTLAMHLQTVLTHPVAIALNQPGPDWNAPGVKLANSFWGAAIAIGFIVCAIAVVAGGACIAIGRGMSNGMLQKVGIGMVLGGIIGAAIVAGAGSLVNWGADRTV